MRFGLHRFPSRYPCWSLLVGRLVVAWVYPWPRPGRYGPLLLWSGLHRAAGCVVFRMGPLVVTWGPR